MSTTSPRPRLRGVGVTVVALLAVTAAICAPRLSAGASRWRWLARVSETAPRHEAIVIRGHALALRTYGPRTGPPVLISSGDGGWFHLAPRVATLLAARGCFVVGFDVRAYLAAFTKGTATLRPENVPRDFEPLIAFAARPTGRRPILIGVSEGAGLSVLAGADPTVKSSVAGIIALGLPDSNELGWRWRDAIIYVTHRSPNEPWFSVQTVVDRLAPLPMAAIHSSHDEYAPLVEARQIIDSAHQPKRLWVVTASNHRFSGNAEGFERALREAMEWVGAHATHRDQPASG